MQNANTRHPTSTIYEKPLQIFSGKDVSWIFWLKFRNQRSHWSFQISIWRREKITSLIHFNLKILCHIIDIWLHMVFLVETKTMLNFLLTKIMLFLQLWANVFSAKNFIYIYYLADAKIHSIFFVPMRNFFKCLQSLFSSLLHYINSQLLYSLPTIGKIFFLKWGLGKKLQHKSCLKSQFWTKYQLKMKNGFVTRIKNKENCYTN